MPTTTCVRCDGYGYVHRGTALPRQVTVSTERATVETVECPCRRRECPGCRRVSWMRMRCVDCDGRGVAACVPAVR